MIVCMMHSVPLPVLEIAETYSSWKKDACGLVFVLHVLDTIKFRLDSNFQLQKIQHG